MMIQLYIIIVKKATKMDLSVVMRVFTTVLPADFNWNDEFHMKIAYKNMEITARHKRH